MTAELLDKQALEELKDIMEEDFPDLVGIFLQDAPTRISTIENAITEKDLDSARQAAHALKGASGNITAIKLCQLCEQFEHECKTNELSKPMEQWANDIQRCFADTAVALNATL